MEMRRSSRMAANPPQIPLWLANSDSEADEEDELYVPTPVKITPARKRHRQAQEAAPSRPNLEGGSKILPPTVLLRILELNPGTNLERWQFAIKFAKSGAFGHFSKEYISAFWDFELRRLGDNELNYRGPFTTIKSLRKAAKDMGIDDIYIASAEKEQLLRLVPQSVPAIIIKMARAAIREIIIQRDIEELYRDLEYNPIVGRLPQIALCTAKHDYVLNDEDLRDLDFIPRDNPHYRNAAPMRLYRHEEVLAVAYRKHGGMKRMFKSILETRKRRKARQQAIEDRRREKLRSALEERGLEIQPDSEVLQKYIKNGKGNVELVADEVLEMEFYSKQTSFQHHYDFELSVARSLGRDWRVSESFKDAMRENAKVRARGDLLESKNIEEIRAMPDLPPDLASKLA